MANLGGNDQDQEAEEDEEDPEPVALIAYQLDPVAIGKK